MNIERLRQAVIDKRFILSANPDWREGRSCGLSDDKTEQKANDALTVILESIAELVVAYLIDDRQSAIKWTGDNLREVISMTGWNESASSKWTWKEYEQVVKEKGLKIFTPNGSVMAGIGDWIVRDGNDCFVLQEYQPTISKMETVEQVAISKTETTSKPCWYCDGIQDHKVVSVKTVVDEFGRELPAYDTPYNYCPNCGRRLEETT
jgi:hypothetical protein